MGEWGPWDFRSGAERPGRRFPGGLFAHVEWDAVWFPWDSSTLDPRGNLEAWRALRFDPYLRKTVPNFTGPWTDKDVRKIVGTEYFGLIAKTELEIPKAGAYELSVVSDDGVRVLIDGEIVSEDWTWHSAKEDRRILDLTKGKHLVELEYFQIYGSAALTISLEAVDN